MLVELGAIKIMVRWIAASKPLTGKAAANASKMSKAKASKLKDKRAIRDALLMHAGGHLDFNPNAPPPSSYPDLPVSAQRAQLHIQLLGALWLMLGQAKPGSDAHHRLLSVGTGCSQ